MNSEEHYLRRELYEWFLKDASGFEFLQQGSLDGIWYWDLENSEHEWMSSRFWTILGYDPGEKPHLASAWQDLIHQDDLRVALDNLAKHSADPSHPYDQVVRYRHKNGSWVWVRCRGVMIRDHAGKPVRMLGAHTDLTALKRAEQELRKRTHELEAANETLQNALQEVRALKGLLPICAGCKKIREDTGYWKQIESYIVEHTGAEISHGLCPDCVDEYFPEGTLGNAE